MKTIQLKGNSKVTLYDSISDLPIENYWKAKELWQIENEVPQDPRKLAEAHNDVIQYIQKDLKQEALTKLTNIMVGHMNMTNGIDNKSLVFASMIHSINGQRMDFSDSNDVLKQKLLDLSKQGLTFGTVMAEVNELKKKLMSSLN